MSAVRYLVALLVLLAAPVTAWTQQLERTTYILFVHTGAGAPIQDIDAKVSAVLASLLRAGYSVRKPDKDRDVVGGPGVDYFNDGDKEAAQEVANIVNKSLQENNAANHELRARLQRVSNPPHYLGIWIF